MMSRAGVLALSSLVVLAACGHTKKPVVKGGPVGPPPRDTANDAAIIDDKVHSLASREVAEPNVL